MDVRVGVTYTAKELHIEMADDVEGDTVRADVEAALSGSSMLWLTDRKGRQVGIPTEKLAYVDIGDGSSAGNIGFGS